MFLRNLLFFYSSSTGIFYYFYNYELLGNIMVSSVAPFYSLDEEFRQMTREEKKEVFIEVLDDYGLEISPSDLNKILDFINHHFAPPEPVSQVKTIPPKPKQVLPKNLGCKSNTYEIQDIKWVHKEGYRILETTREVQGYKLKYKLYKLELEIYSQGGNCQATGTYLPVGTEQDFVDSSINLGDDMNSTLWTYEDAKYKTKEELTDYLKEKITSNT